jgi:hypothetical protein
MMLKADFAYVARPLNYYRWHDNTVRKDCLGNVMQDVEELKVYSYLLSHMPVSRAAAERICERSVQRWLHHSLSLRRIENSRAYDLQLLRLLGQLDRWYVGRIAKHIVYTIVGKSLSAGKRILTARR